MYNTLDVDSTASSPALPFDHHHCNVHNAHNKLSSPFLDQLNSLKMEH